MIPNRSWQQFIKSKENKDLTLTEQKRKYSDERKRYDQQQTKNVKRWNNILV